MSTLLVTETTWEYLSQGRLSRPSNEYGEISQQDCDPKKTWVSLNSASGRIEPELSEVQLYQIKTGLGLIEELWRDFSMGANHVAHSQFLSVHKCVKEIGKELYSSIFMEQTIPNQVYVIRFNRHTTFLIW